MKAKTLPTLGRSPPYTLSIPVTDDSAPLSRSLTTYLDTEEPDMGQDLTGACVADSVESMDRFQGVCELSPETKP